MTPALVFLLLIVATLAVTVFVARRVPRAALAYPLAIFAGGAVFVVLYLILVFWLSFALLNTPIQ